MTPEKLAAAKDLAIRIEDLKARLAQSKLSPGSLTSPEAMEQVQTILRRDLEKQLATAQAEFALL